MLHKVTSTRTKAMKHDVTYMSTGKSIDQEAGVEIILSSPDDIVTNYAIKVRFLASNNS